MIYFQRHVNQIIACKDGEIQTLQTENDRLRAQVEYERKRADVAVDRLLNQAQVVEISSAPERKILKADEIIKNIQAAAGIGQSYEEKR